MVSYYGLPRFSVLVSHLHMFSCKEIELEGRQKLAFHNINHQ